MTGPNVEEKDRATLRELVDWQPDPDELAAGWGEGAEAEASQAAMMAVLGPEAQVMG